MAKAVKRTEKNEVAKPAGRNVYQNFKDETSSSNIEGSLLRFTKQGDWVAGADQEELDEGTELIVGVDTIKRGWQKWQDQKPVDFRMGLLNEGFRPPSRDELGDLDEGEWEAPEGEPRDPWQETTQCLMLDPKSGDVYTFSTSSKSGKTALGEVSGAYGDRMQDGEDETAMPIVKLTSSHYKHKVYGKIMIPVFELTGDWVTPPERKETEKPKAKAKPSVKATNSKAPKALAPPRGASRSGARI